MDYTQANGNNGNTNGASQGFVEQGRFDDPFNIQNVIFKCLNTMSNPAEYITAVRHLQYVVLGDPTSPTFNHELHSKIKEIEDEFNAKGRVQKEDLGVQWEYAQRKFEVLYGRLKRKAPFKAVLAVGRPKCTNKTKCPNCSTEIICNKIIEWERTTKTKEVDEDGE